MRSQIKTDKIIIKFLGDIEIKTPEDLEMLNDKILKFLKFRPYNDRTKKQADKLHWKRTASKILRDKVVYKGKACTDIAVVFLALCKAAKVQGRLVKLITFDKSKTHSIVEVKLKQGWYRIDPSMKTGKAFKGALTKKSVWNKEYRVWKKGRDIWDILSRKDKDLQILKPYPKITFPKGEWAYIKKVLATEGHFSSIRCCKEYGKYKKGSIYETPWNDLIKITEVKKYTKAEKIPTWNLLTKKMQKSVKMGEKYGDSKWDHIKFKKYKPV